MKATPRPTRLGWLPLIAAPVLGVLSVMTVDSWLLLLAGASLGLGVAAILLRPRLSDLDVVVDVPARADLGQPVATRLTVRNSGRRTSPLTTLTHTVVGLTDVTVVVDALAPGATAQVSVERSAVTRGRTSTSRALLVSSAPLGLVITQAAGDLTTELTVHPALVPVRLPPSRSLGASTRQARPDRSGVDVHGIREWQSGDEARQVHWRSTARRGRLVVLEREVPRGGTLDILVVGPTSEPGWERLVSLVASTAVAALGAGYVMSLVAAQPGLDPLRVTSRTSLLDWCAALDPPGLPDQRLIESALAATGRGGLLHVAVTALPASWWHAVESMAAAAGVEIRQLEDPRPAAGSVATW